MKFNNFDQTRKNQQVFEKVKQFISSQKSLYLYGLPGLGKTHLLISALQEMRTYLHSYEYAFYNIARFLKIERLDFETKEESEERLLNSLSKKTYIFLDDFCAENVSGKTAEFMYLLFDDAIANGKPQFFITGNKSIEFVSKHISDRIASRIVGLCGKENIVKLEGNDRRLL